MILITTYAEYLRIINMNFKCKTILEPVTDFESEKCAHVYSICWPIGHYLPNTLHSMLTLIDEGSTCFTLLLAREPVLDQIAIDMWG